MGEEKKDSAGKKCPQLKKNTPQIVEIKTYYSWKYCFLSF